MANENELLQAVLEARKKVSEYEGFLKDAKEVKTNAEMALVEYMDNRELKSFKSTAFNCAVVRKATLYVSIAEDKKDEAFRWIEEDMGRNDMIKPSIHNKTLSSFISDLLKKGEKLPQGVFVYFFKPELTIITAK
jgi:hypothetical protein